MKLVFAVINDDDEKRLIDAINKNNFRVTRMCSSGGFLKAGNITLMTAVEDQRLDALITIIKENCKSRKRMYDKYSNDDINYDVAFAINSLDKAVHLEKEEYAATKKISETEIQVGGATIFILNVERYVKM